MVLRWDRQKEQEMINLVIIIFCIEWLKVIQYFHSFSHYQYKETLTIFQIKYSSIFIV